jgi:type II secretory pathway pseudopilin PulG
MSKSPAGKFAMRGGISLIEVLVSLFILAVGLLSIAALLPVGQFQVGQAELDERKAIVAQNASRSFRTRGMGDYRMWLAKNPLTAGSFTGPLFLDPLWYGAALPQYNVPASGPNTFQRITLRQSLKNANSPGLSSPEAEAIYVSRDDLLLDPAPDPESAPLSRYEGGNTAPIRRDFEGNYSWLAMIQPAVSTWTGHASAAIGPADLAVSHSMGQPVNQNSPQRYNKIPAYTPYAGMPVQLSLVVFFKRPTNPQNAAALNDENGIPRERQVTIDFSIGNGIGGGEANISHNNADYLLLKPGEWALAHGTLNGRTVAIWYKILTADQINGTSRQITLAGPDWPVAATNSKLILFDGAISVHSKTIHLEGPSPWN